MSTLAHHWDAFRSHFEPKQAPLQTAQLQPVPIQIESQLGALDALIVERDAKTKALLKEMVEVNELWKDLSTLTAMQSPLVDNIDTNISIAHNSVVEAKKELEKANNSQKNSREIKAGIIGGISLATLTAVVTTLVILLWARLLFLLSLL